jgi:hypothetical protein
VFEAWWGRAQSAGEGHVGALFSGMNFMSVWQAISGSKGVLIGCIHLSNRYNVLFGYQFFFRIA